MAHLSRVYVHVFVHIAVQYLGLQLDAVEFSRTLVGGFDIPHSGSKILLPSVRLSMQIETLCGSRVQYPIYTNRPLDPDKCWKLDRLKVRHTGRNIHIICEY